MDDIGEFLGYEVAKVLPVKARILCGGGEKEAKKKGEYSGVQDCAAAALLGGGNKVCDYGCLGLGSCVKACPFDAMFMDNNGLPRIIDEKCTGCGICVDSCPKKIIEMLPTDLQYYVKCSSKDKGAVSRKACSLSCIGCLKCVKECPEQAILFEDNLAKIDPEKCKNMGICFEVCPTKCIIKNTAKIARKGVA
ncbi:MAG: 4Fe-4S dicluster domain-containing protein [Actinobacteria bacterium]|nr:MAG: 4Fe-4S dicluster domain-containing protein [Actinomycetota bacterium]